MSVPELTAPAAGANFGARRSALTVPRAPRFYLVLVAVALTLGAISLLIPSTPSYDPWAWLVWGREIVHFKLQTTGGPTWKPLTVIFTTIFAPFGRAAPDLWLVVARAGAVMAVVMVFRLSFRLVRAVAATPEGGRLLQYGPALLGGAIAAVGLALTGGFASNSALGYSEGLMTALVLIAVERHLDGAPRQAFAVGFLAALDRPELWLFWGAYGLWLFWRDPQARWLVLGLFALIPVLWFLPEYWGSGHFFRGVSRAHTPRSNSAAFAKCPFCSELVKHAWPTVLLRIKVAAALGAAVAAWVLARAVRTRGRDWRSWRLETPPEHALAGMIVAAVLGITWWVLIAVLTQAGFSGNDRYLVLGASLIEVTGGVAFGWLAFALARRAPAWIAALRPHVAAVAAAAVGLVALVFVFVPNQVGANLIDLQRTHRALVFQAQLRSSAAAAVAALGGPGRLRVCGSVMTEGFQVPMLAWTLGVHTATVLASPLSPSRAGAAPNIIFQTREHRHAHLLPPLSDWPGVAYRLVLHNRTFRVYEHCRA